MVYAAILAGGSGRRMGGELPKQFLEIGGKPVIVHTVERFAAYSGFEKIIVMTPAEWTEYTEELLAEFIGDPSRIVVSAGGDTRNETLMNAIDVIENSGTYCNCLYDEPC
jgi:2-C-methyl-D-erythritol 4-phosphate cytidylyltransferase